MTKNKFAGPPYLPEFDGLTAVKLKRILHILGETCLQMGGTRLAIKNIDQLISHPSSIRKCDLYDLKPVVEAINRLEAEVLDHAA